MWLWRNPDCDFSRKLQIFCTPCILHPHSCPSTKFDGSTALTWSRWGCHWLATYPFKTPYNPNNHSSKTANIFLPQVFCQNVVQSPMFYHESCCKMIFAVLELPLLPLQWVLVWKVFNINLRYNSVIHIEHTHICQSMQIHPLSVSSSKNAFWSARG